MQGNEIKRPVTEKKGPVSMHNVVEIGQTTTVKMSSGIFLHCPLIWWVEEDFLLADCVGIEKRECLTFLFVFHLNSSSNSLLSLNAVQYQFLCLSI